LQNLRQERRMNDSGKTEKLKRFNGRLLVVDDETEIMTSLCSILSEVGYDVVGFTRGIDALEILSKQNFDALLADLDMPEMNGLELLKSALDIDPHLMGFIIAGKGTVHNAIKALEIGAVDIIAKPFTLEVLRIKISRAVEIRHLIRREDLLRCIFENSPEGIYLMTPDDRYIMANKSMARVLGYLSPDELIAEQAAHGNRHSGPEGRMKMKRLLNRIDSVTAFESRIVRMDESRIWISEDVNVIRDAQGRVIYYRGTVRDITGKKSSEETMRETEKNLRLLADRAERGRELCLDMIDEMCNTCCDLQENIVCFLRALSNAVDGKRAWMKGQSERVAACSLKIAHEIGIDEAERNNIRLAALCRDMGKLSIDDSLIDKPSRLTEEEYEMIKQHPVQAADLLQCIGHFDDIIPLIRHHHERMDGRGYPDGLREDDIPVGAKILHLAESFTAMTSERPYRSALSRHNAILELKKCNGSQFDPRIAQAAIKVLSD
jgi:PAS domain S-box-containing protein